MNVQLPSLGADGSVVFAAPGDFETCWTTALSRGALVVRPARALQPFEQLNVQLVILGFASLVVRAEVIALEPDRALLRLIDGPPPRPAFEFTPPPMAPVPVAAVPVAYAPPSLVQGSPPTALAPATPATGVFLQASSPRPSEAFPLPPPSYAAMPGAFDTSALSALRSADVPSFDAPPPPLEPAPSSGPALHDGNTGSLSLMEMLPKPFAEVPVPEIVPTLSASNERTSNTESVAAAPALSSMEAPATAKISLSAVGLGTLARFTGSALEFDTLEALGEARSSLAGIGAILASTDVVIPTVPVDVRIIVGPFGTTARARVSVALAAPGTAVVQAEQRNAFAKLLEEVDEVLPPPQKDPSPPTQGAPDQTGAIKNAFDTNPGLTPSSSQPILVPSHPGGDPMSSSPFSRAPGQPGASKELRTFMKSVFEKYTAVEDPQKTPRQLSFAREGSLHNPTTPQDILNLPLTRAPNDDELAFPSAPLLLRWLRTTRGVMRLELAAENQPVFTIIFVDGREVRSPASFATLGKSIAVPSLTYTITELGRPPQLATTGRTLHLIGEVVRALCSQCELEQLALAFPERDGKCPRALPDIVAGLGFPPQHHRFIKTDVNGSLFLADIVRAPVGARVVWESIYLLELFNGLSWDEPPEGKTATRSAPLPRSPSMPPMPAVEETSPFDGKDHFHVLGLHWSSSPLEITPAFHRLRTEYGPGGFKRPSDEKLAARVMQQLEDAHRVLSGSETRKAYRREKFNLVWAHQAQLLVQKAKMSLYRKDLEEAEGTLLAAEDMSPSAEAQTILAAIRRKKAAR